jgi:hypothetical protein
MTFYVATLETRNFIFTAYGKTADDARWFMKCAWKKHAKNTGAWLTWEELVNDVRIEETRIGDVTIR